MIQKKRTLSKRKWRELVKAVESCRKFRGEREATNFFGHLRHLEPDRRERILRGMRILQRAETLAAVWHPRARAATVELEELIKPEGPIHLFFAACRVQPAIVDYRSGSLDFSLIQENDEIAAIWLLGQLVQMGLVSRLRRCESCDRLIFARFAHQTTCPGGKCRRDKYERSPQGKAYHRRKSREYYWLRKEKNVK